MSILPSFGPGWHLILIQLKTVQDKGILGSDLKSLAIIFFTAFLAPLWKSESNQLICQCTGWSTQDVASLFSVSCINSSAYIVCSNNEEAQAFEYAGQSFAKEMNKPEQTKFTVRAAKRKCLF